MSVRIVPPLYFTPDVTFDPSVLPISDWRTPNYAGLLPWGARASAGTSGASPEVASVFGNTTAPVAGRVLNGFTSARYSSGAKGSSPAGANSTRITPAAYSLCMLVYPESLGASGGPDPYQEAFLYGESYGYGWQTTLSVDGLKVSRFNGASWDSRALACAAGGWRLLDVRFGGGSLELQVDGAGWSTSAFGNATTSGVNPATGGAVYNLAATTDFDLMERIIVPAQLSRAAFALLHDYFNAKYLTAFPR